MQNDAPRVTIGMPVYNAGQMIRTAIESVLAQDFTDFELIISDNASRDETYDICSEYVQRDRRVRLVRNEVNLGAAPNYNRTLQLARGDYFKWQCHDDWCAPSFLRRCIEVLDSDPSVVLASPRTIIVDDDGQHLSHYREPADGSSTDVVERFSRFYWNLALSNLLFGVMRTEMLKSTSDWHPHYWEGDKVLLYEIALRGRIVEVPEYLFYRRLGSPRVRDSRWFNVANREGLVPRRVQVYQKQLGALFRSPLPLRQKTVLSSHIGLRFLVGQKSKRLLDAWTGRYQPAEEPVGRGREV